MVAGGEGNPPARAGGMVAGKEGGIGALRLVLWELGEFIKGLRATEAQTGHQVLAKGNSKRAPPSKVYKKLLICHFFLVISG